VAGGCCSRVTGRSPPPTPDVNRPANTRTVNVAAAMTAAPMTTAPTTKALRITLRVSSCRDARRSALVLRRPSAYADELWFRPPQRGSANGSVRARKSSSRWVTFPVLRATASSSLPPHRPAVGPSNVVGASRGRRPASWERSPRAGRVLGMPAPADLLGWGRPLRNLPGLGKSAPVCRSSRAMPAALDFTQRCAIRHSTPTETQRWRCSPLRAEVSEQDLLASCVVKGGVGRVCR
jgi:hypothetical protein